MQDPTSWTNEAFDTMRVGDPLTEAWLDRFRELLSALIAAKRVVAMADEYLLAGEGVGLRYYFYDSPAALAEFNAALDAADIALKSDEPPKT